MVDYYKYPAIALTGGADGALDAFDGSILKDGDSAYVDIPATQKHYTYTLDADSGATENSPLVISPDSNAGLKRWILIEGDAPHVDFIQSGTGATTRNLQDKMQEYVSVTDFGAVGNGVSNDKAAIVAAFTASNHVFFPAGTYYVGQFTSSAKIIDLSALGEGVSILTSGDVELVCETIGEYIPMFFYLSGNSNFHCGPIRFKDLGYDSSKTWQGAVGFQISLTGTADFGNLTFDRIYGKNIVNPVRVSNESGAQDIAHRIRGIHIKQLFSDDCFYGYVGQNQGDAVRIDNLVAYQNVRCFFVYGVTDIHANIFERNKLGSTGSVNISRSVGGLDTKSIKIKYVARETDDAHAHVLINHIDLLGGEISGIDLDLDIKSDHSYYPLRFYNYDGSGSVTAGASLNKVHDITVRGNFDANALPIELTATYTDAGILRLIPGSNFDITATALSRFKVRGHYTNTAFATVWASSGTQPAIVNGTISSRYDIVEGICHLQVDMLMGASTTYGTGGWTFSAPFTAQASASGAISILDSGTKSYLGVARLYASTSTIDLIINDSASSISATVPFTWAVNDRLVFSLSYYIV